MDAAPPPAYVIAAAAVWPPICAAAVALRFYARRKMRMTLMLDDWLVLPALLLTTGMGASIIVAVALRSLGYPTPLPAPGATSTTSSNFEIRTTRTTLWAFELMQIPALGTVKLSFVFFYRRLFCSTSGNKSFSIMTHLVTAVIILWTVSLWFALFFACGTNFAAWWTSISTVTNDCIATLKLENGFAISDTITDIIVFILPIHQICKLHMSTAKKFAVIGIFSLGALTIAASMTRMVVFIKAVEVDFQVHQDNDLIITGGLYWSMIESGLGLTAACLPTIYGLFRGKFTPSFIYSMWTGASSGGTGASSSQSRPNWRSRYSLTGGKHRERVGSNASNVHIVNSTSKPGAVETHVMKDLILDFPQQRLDYGKIRVTNVVTLTEAMV